MIEPHDWDRWISNNVYIALHLHDIIFTISAYLERPLSDHKRNRRGTDRS